MVELDRGQRELSARQCRQRIALCVVLCALLIVVVTRFERSAVSTDRGDGVAIRSHEWYQNPARAMAGNESARVLWPVELDRDFFMSSQAGMKDRSNEETLLIRPAVDQTALSRSTIGSLHLQGIVSGQVSLAIINGVMVSVGDTVDGFRVLEIRDRHVVVERDGMRIQVEL